jgi:hypothetical protein
MGKLHNSIKFYGPIVIKEEIPLTEELEVMITKASVPGFWIGNRYVMPRGKPAELEDLQESIRLLEQYVWTRPRKNHPEWHSLLINHLQHIYPSKHLIERVRDLQSNSSRMIHGDTTIANLIRLPILGLRWIDPCYRNYIPGDPLVDIGKVLQSCWNYEGVLRGQQPVLYTKWWNIITSSYPPEPAITWMLVHFARLLRYHTSDVSKKFQEVLVDVYSCDLRQ